MIQRKYAQIPPNQMATILEANKHHHALVASMYYSRHHLQLIAAHGTTPHPIQCFACLQEEAIADALANHSATKIQHSRNCTTTNVQTTSAAFGIYRAQATN
jgi:hypothetical protein